MADGGKKSSKKFLIFAHENGEPMSFYMAPSSEKAELKTDILVHGGKYALTIEREKEGVIKLAAEGVTLPAGTTNYFSIDFIKDCCSKDQKLNLEDYRLSADASGIFFSKKHLDYQEGLMGEFDDLIPEGNGTTIVCSSKELKGRKKYRLSEDKAIITYLVKNEKLSHVTGNSVWRTMESLEITNHPWQSMKDRYIKYIQPNLKTFDLPLNVSKELCKFYPTLKADSKGQDKIEIHDASTDSDVVSEISLEDETLIKAADAAKSDAYSSSSAVVTRNGNRSNDLDPQPGTSAQSRKNNENIPVKQTPLKKQFSNLTPVQETNTKCGPSLSNNLDDAKNSNKSHRRKQKLVLRTEFSDGDGQDLPGPSRDDSSDNNSKTRVRLTPQKKISRNQKPVQGGSRKRRQSLSDDSDAMQSNKSLQCRKRGILSTTENSSECDDIDEIDSPGSGDNAKRARTQSPKVEQNSLNRKKISKYFVNVGKTQPSATAKVGKTQPSATVNVGKTQPSATVNVGKTRPSATVKAGRTQPSATVNIGKTQPSATVNVRKTQPSATENVGKTRPSPIVTRSKIGRSARESNNEESVTSRESVGSCDETRDMVTASASMCSGDESSGMETENEKLRSDSENDVSPSPVQTCANTPVDDGDEQETFEEMDETYMCKEGELHLDSDDSEDDGVETIRLSKSEADEVFEGFKSFGLEPEKIKTILWTFSGVVEDALSFIQGVDLPFWTRADDENLCSGKNLDSLDKFTFHQKKARKEFLKPMRKAYLDFS